MPGISIFPRLTPTSEKDRPERLLLLCYFDHRGISTVPQNISFLQRTSKFEVDVYNFAGCEAPFRLPASFDLTAYVGIVLHNSLAYNVDNLRELDENLAVRFKDYEGVKVVFKQDENYKVRGTARYLGENRFDLIFTCLPENEREKVYPRDVVGDVEFFRMLTGYVTPDLRDNLVSRFGNEERDIDVGYRGSLQPLDFGRLCYEKRTIGWDFLTATQGMGLRMDISSRWEDRFSGDDWLRFMCRCKAMLGVESGASIFDLDGDVARAIAEYDVTSTLDKTSREYAEGLLQHIVQFEGNVYYNNISPRHLEAAAAKTLQILFEGEYSNVLVPGKHYVELKRDFSNVEQVVAILRDDAARTAIVEAAWRDIIAAPTYWIETFVARFDERIEAQIAKKSWAQPAIQLAPLRKDRINVLLLCSHYPDRDPRIKWLQKNAPDEIVVHVLGVDGGPRDQVIVERDASIGYTIVAPRPYNHLLTLNSILSEERPEGTAFEEALFLGWLESMPAEHISHAYGISRIYSIANTRDIARYFLNTAGVLADLGGRIRGIDAIIACDLETLLPAALIKHRLGVPVMYDAHEFWPDSNDAFMPAEFELWQKFERRLLPYVDDAVTVTRGLASFMSSFYGRQFGTLPNCEPLEAVDTLSQASSNRAFELEREEDQVAFLVQGNFAIGRGFEILIDIWNQVDKRAKLFLRGPDSSYKASLIERARSNESLDTRIVFPAAVPESALVAAASHADVGIIPYEPKSINNRYCGPNKLSQYMAAGLPIMSNRLESVAEVLHEGDCGFAVDFTNLADVIHCVNTLTADAALRKRLGANARVHFSAHYNWNAVAKTFYADVLALAESRKDIDKRVSANEPSRIRAAVPIITLKQETESQAQPPAFVSGPVWRGARAIWRMIPTRVRNAFRGRVHGILIFLVKRL